MSNNKIVYKGDMPESTRNANSFPTPKQLATLNEVYINCPNPQKTTIKSLSQQLQTTQINIINWFQSRREYESRSSTTNNEPKLQNFEMNPLPNSLKYKKLEDLVEGLEHSKNKAPMMHKGLHNEFNSMTKTLNNGYQPSPRPQHFLPSPMPNLNQPSTNVYDKPNYNHSFNNNRIGLKISPLEELKKDKTIPTDPLYYHLSDNRNFIEFNYGYIEPTSTPKAYINQKLALNTSKISIRKLDVSSS